MVQQLFLSPSSLHLFTTLCGYCGILDIPKCWFIVGYRLTDDETHILVFFLAVSGPLSGRWSLWPKEGNAGTGASRRTPRGPICRRRTSGAASPCLAGRTLLRESSLFRQPGILSLVVCYPVVRSVCRLYGCVEHFIRMASHKSVELFPRSSRENTKFTFLCAM